MRYIPRITAGEPFQVGANAWNSLRQASTGYRPAGVSTFARPQRLVFLAVNQSGNPIPAGGVLGIDREQSLMTYEGQEETWKAQPGVVGVIPRLKTATEPNIVDHLLDWCVALQDIGEQSGSVGLVCLSGMCWVNVIVNDEEHLFVGPKDNQTDYGQTSSGGLARILQLSPPVDGQDVRQALVNLDPSAPVRFEGYLINGLTSPVASVTTSTILTDAAITSGTQVVTSPSGGFVDNLDEPGISIEITGAGASGATISTTATYQNANTITIDAVAQTTVTGATVRRVRTQFTPTTANAQIFEKRGPQWFRTRHQVKIENMDHSLSILGGTFVRFESWMRDKWRVYTWSCNPVGNGVTGKSNALEDP